MASLNDALVGAEQHLRPAGGEFNRSRDRRRASGFVGQAREILGRPAAGRYLGELVALGELSAAVAAEALCDRCLPGAGVARKDPQARLSAMRPPGDSLGQAHRDVFPEHRANESEVLAVGGLLVSIKDAQRSKGRHDR